MCKDKKNAKVKQDGTDESLACETLNTNDEQKDSKPAKKRCFFKCGKSEFKTVESEDGTEIMPFWKRWLKRFDEVKFLIFLSGLVVGFIGGIYQFSVETQGKIEENRIIQEMENQIGLLSLINVIAVDRFNQINRFAISKGVDTKDFLTAQNKETEELKKLLTERATFDKQEELQEALDEITNGAN